jgi:hypothetical protein
MSSALPQINITACITANPVVDDPLDHVTDKRMRCAFEKVFAETRACVDFTRGHRGSYKNDRLEAKYQGFKLAVEGIVSEDVVLYDLTRVTRGQYDLTPLEQIDDSLDYRG